MYNHNTPPKESLIKRALKRPETIPLIFFVSALSLWLAFLSKVYFENHHGNNITKTIPVINNVKEPLSMQPVAYQVTSESEMVPSYTDVNYNINKINQLTEQLMLQQQKTKELSRIVKQQKTDLNSLIQKTVSNSMQKSVTQASINDQKYISILSKNKNTQTENTAIALVNTDYYNRVVIDSSNTNFNSFQGKINSFIDDHNTNTANKTGVEYVAKLEKESDVRRNEMRSIALKKGESIWMIAKRAYGKGFLYYKIMKANPQITEENARYLAPGTIIRVPI